MARSNAPSLLSDLLDELGVRHTATFTKQTYDSMNFRSLFGLGKALKKYGVDYAAFQMEDRDAVESLAVPFVAQTGPGKFVVVREFTPARVTVVYSGKESTITRSEWNRTWTGLVMLAFTSADSSEPEYTAHRAMEIALRAKRWVLAVALLAICAYFFVANGLWCHWWSVALVLLDFAGIYVSYLLVLKSMHVHSQAADRVCGVLQAHGCDTVLEQRASTFYGIFGWSAVGLSYFSVSLGALLVAPQAWTWLAWISVCALPFTVWSISYQKFVIKAWCTLCVTVQSILWLEFFCMLGGGIISRPPLNFAVPALLIAFYVAALLAIDFLEQKGQACNNRSNSPVSVKSNKI